MMPSIGGLVALAGANALAGLAISWELNEMFKQDWASLMAFVSSKLPFFVVNTRKLHPAGTPLFANLEIDVTTSQSHGGDVGWMPNRTGLQIYSVHVTDRNLPAASRVVDKSRGFWPPGYMSETTRLSFSVAIPDTP
jgi:hypothetical protein